MRTRTILLIIAIALIAGFAALNMDEFTRRSVLSLGFTTVEVPLGMVMLVLLMVALVFFLATTLYMQSMNLLETRQHSRELNAQRELADRAEVSRYTELRTYLEAQSAATATREAENLRLLADRMTQSHTALLHRMEQSDNATAAYLGQLEDRFDRRDSRGSGPTPLV